MSIDDLTGKFGWTGLAATIVSLVLLVSSATAGTASAEACSGNPSANKRYTTKAVNLRDILAPEATFSPRSRAAKWCTPTARQKHGLQ